VLACEGQTFVLDMGEQIKVLDIARNLIRLSGFVPDEEIPIAFIGLRPGEKLVEELVGKGETLEPSGTEKILHVQRTEVLELVRPAEVAALVRVAALGQSREVLGQLRRIVPTFNSDVWRAAEGLAPSAVPARRRLAGQAVPLPASRAVAVAASAPQG